MQCSDSRECAKEFAARVHLLLSRPSGPGSGERVLPVRDPVLVGARDYLAKVRCRGMDRACGARRGREGCLRLP